MVSLQLVKVAAMGGGAMVEVVMHHVIHHIAKQAAREGPSDCNAWEDHPQHGIDERSDNCCSNWGEDQPVSVKRGLEERQEDIIRIT